MQRSPSIVFSLALVLLYGAPAHAADACPYAKNLPEFKLQDPAGEIHTRALCAKGAVLIVTAPTLVHGASQKEWQHTLRDRFAGWGKTGAALIILEDMTQTWFKGKVMKKMKEKYTSGQHPVLLIDEEAQLRKALEVEKDALKNKTVILVYDADGKLVHYETEKVENANVEKIVALAKGSTP